MFTDIKEFNAHIKTDLTVLDRLVPFMEEARMTVANFISMAQLVEIEKFQLRPAGDTIFEGREQKLDVVLSKAKYAYAAALVMVASPFIDINISGVGFTTASQANQVAASSERVTRLNSGLAALLSARIDALLGTLEQYASDFPLWQNSACCSIFTDCILSKVDYVVAATGEPCYRQLFARNYTSIRSEERRVRSKFFPVFETLPGEKDGPEKKEAYDIFRCHVALTVFVGKSSKGVDYLNDLKIFVCQHAAELGYPMPTGYTNTADSPIFFM